jgi:anhydro-N-acetylmuramic acid kinase
MRLVLDFERRYVKFGGQIYSLIFIFKTRNPNNMVYRAIGIMSGSAMEGLDIVFAEFHESKGTWTYTLQAADCYPYAAEWVEKLRKAASLSTPDYLVLHSEYGHYIGQELNRFIDKHQLQYKVQLVASHGHTIFHMPDKRVTAQLGDGAAIAGVTGINVVSDLRSMDVALGGKGAPLVPLGEKLLFGDHSCFLNIGTHAYITCHTPEGLIAFDICAANKVLNMLANQAGEKFDMDGKIAANGALNTGLLKILNELEYYSMAYPKSLSIDFSTAVVFPLVRGMGISIPDAMRTYVEHIAVQTANALKQLPQQSKLLVTGGGANNSFLVSRIKAVLEDMQVDAVLPEKNIIEYKEALAMALIGLLRWREENNTIAAYTGATRDSIGGAVWIGQEA